MRHKPFRATWAIKPVFLFPIAAVHQLAWFEFDSIDWRCLSDNLLSEHKVQLWASLSEWCNICPRALWRNTWGPTTSPRHPQVYKFVTWPPTSTSLGNITQPLSKIRDNILQKVEDGGTSSSFDLSIITVVWFTESEDVGTRGRRAD